MVAYAINVAEIIDTCEEPLTYEETLSFEDSSRWMISMQEEMDSLLNKSTPARGLHSDRVLSICFLFQFVGGYQSISGFMLLVIEVVEM